MRNVTIKGLLAHKLRLGLTSLAIVLGVTFIAGTFVLTDTLNKTFDTLFGSIYQHIDFEVRGVAQIGSGANAQRNTVPESVLSTVRAVPGVEAEDLMTLDLPALIVPGQDTSHAPSAARYLQECLPSNEYWDVPVSEQTAQTAPARVLDFLRASGA